MAMTVIGPITSSATSGFTAKQDFAAGLDPVSVAVGDLNGDGRLDLIVANFNSNNVSVLLNITAPGGLTPIFATNRTWTPAMVLYTSRRVI